MYVHAYLGRRGDPPVELPDPHDPASNGRRATRERRIVFVLVVHFLHKLHVLDKEVQNEREAPSDIQTRQPQSECKKKQSITGPPGYTVNNRATGLHSQQQDHQATQSTTGPPGYTVNNRTTGLQSCPPFKSLQIVQGSFHARNLLKHLIHMELKLGLRAKQ